MSKDNPGGEPGNNMYNLGGLLVGFSADGGDTVKEPALYTADEKVTLRAAVTRNGIDRYRAEDREYIESVLGPLDNIAA